VTEADGGPASDESKGANPIIYYFVTF